MQTNKDSTGKTYYCSFCGKSQYEVKRLAAGPSVFICDECSDLVRDVFADEARNEIADGKVTTHRKCSFCGKLESEVKKIVSGPDGAICNECIELTTDVMADEDEAAGIRIRRSIEFAPEHKQAGIAILSYFSRIIEQKYPNEAVSVRIEQEGSIVTLVVQTNAGIAERIQHTLDEYGKVVMGAVAPERLFDDPMHSLELKSKLEMTALELRLTKELYSSARQLQDARVMALEDQVKELHSYIGNGLSHVSQLHNLLTDLIKTKPNNVEVIEATNRLVKIIQRGVTQKDEHSTKSALETIASQDHNLFGHIVDVLENTLGGTSGNLLASWITAVAIASPK